MSTSANPSVLIERRGAALWITINRPDKRNAIDASVIAGIRRGYAEAHADPAVRVIVLTGAGERAFCAGADLQPGGAFAFDPARPGTDYADLLRTAHAATLPSIARMAYLPRRIAVGDLSTMRLISQSTLASSSADGTT